VPDKWSVIYDNNDLLIINKPSGLPVLPAGGFMEHSLLKLLEKQYQNDKYGLPRPVHRLGRFTSGLLVCARKSESRAWLSALLRDHQAPNDCRKIYRALLQIPTSDSALLALPPRTSFELNTPIGLRPHHRLGRIWAAASDPTASDCLPASSELQILQKGAKAWLAQIKIATGRPHQIRIHTATAGAPLLGDPLYMPGGSTSDALPGDGGYHLHAHQLLLPLANGEKLNLKAPLPKLLKTFIQF
jgi:23S rRNA pseudouridine1911/1915/1917 synthase